MQSIEIIGLALLLALVLSIVLIAVRRWSLTRAGGIDICWRTRLYPDGRGWTFGQGRYTDRGLVLYRSFSPLPIASRVLERDHLVLRDRRPLTGVEADLLPVGVIVVGGADGSEQLELALGEDTLTGLRSWLESVPHRTGGGLREI